MGRRDGADARVVAWWDVVLAGDSDEPHPVYGRHVSAQVRDEKLTLTGELVEPQDREQLVRQARARVGRGFREVDASKLRLVDRTESPGILEQTLVAAYPDATTARRAGKYVVEHSQVQPRQQAVIEPGTSNLRQMLPLDYIGDARKRLDRGESLLVLKVDETDAFRVRELMEEDTRSSWTAATPPRRT